MKKRPKTPKIKIKDVSAIMGQKVIVSWELKRRMLYSRDGVHTVQWEQSKHFPQVGWIAGLRYLQNGLKKFGSSRYCEYEPGYLRVTETIPALMVCYYPTYKPIPVPVLGCCLYEEDCL